MAMPITAQPPPQRSPLQESSATPRHQKAQPSQIQAISQNQCNGSVPGPHSSSSLALLSPPHSASTFPRVWLKLCFIQKSSCHLHLQVGENVLFFQSQKHLIASLMTLRTGCFWLVVSTPQRGCQVYVKPRLDAGWMVPTLPFTGL